MARAVRRVVWFAGLWVSERRRVWYDDGHLSLCRWLDWITLLTEYVHTCRACSTLLIHC